MSVSKMDATEFGVEENSFWKAVEDVLSEPIPLYLKRMVTAAGYARYSVLKVISDDFKVKRFRIHCHTLSPRDFRSTYLIKKATHINELLILALLRCSKNKIRTSGAFVQDCLRFVPLKTRVGDTSQPLWQSLLDSETFHLKAELECFAREQMTMFEKTAENFHIFYRDPREFRIVPGHWNLLRELSKKLPDNKKLFLKLQHKVNESTLQVVSQRIPPLKPMKNASGSGTSKKTIDDESSMLIQSKIKTWLEAKAIETPGEIHVDILGPRRASVVCFHCTKSVALSTRENKNGSWGWIVSNFTQHVLQHASSKRNTLDNYFHRATCTGYDSADLASNKPVVESSIEAAENEINVPIDTEMNSSSVMDSVTQGTAKLVAPALAPSFNDPVQKFEYVVYEEMVESYDDRPSDHPEYLTYTSLCSGNPRGSPVEILQESNLEYAQENKCTLKTVLEIEYV